MRRTSAVRKTSISSREIGHPAGNRTGGKRRTRDFVDPRRSGPHGRTRLEQLPPGSVRHVRDAGPGRIVPNTATTCSPIRNTPRIGRCCCACRGAPDRGSRWTCDRAVSRRRKGGQGAAQGVPSPSGCVSWERSPSNGVARSGRDRWAAHERPAQKRSCAPTASRCPSGRGRGRLSDAHLRRARAPMARPAAGGPAAAHRTAGLGARRPAGPVPPWLRQSTRTLAQDLLCK